jgi:hypothetical protein
MSKEKTISRAVVDRVWELVGYGLPAGLGSRGHGTMCVQACVNAALDSDHHDRPICVSEQMTHFGIALNDRYGWLDEKDRGDGLRRWAIAQLGTSELPEEDFAELVALELCRTEFPRMLAASKLTEAEWAAINACETVAAVVDALHGFSRERVASGSDLERLYGPLRAMAYQLDETLRNLEACPEEYWGPLFDLFDYACNSKSNRELAELGVRVCQQMKTEGSDWLREFESREGDDLVEWLLEQKKIGKEQEDRARRATELFDWMLSKDLAGEEQLEKLERATAPGKA